MEYVPTNLPPKTGPTYSIHGAFGNHQPTINPYQYLKPSIASPTRRPRVSSVSISRHRSSVSWRHLEDGSGAASPVAIGTVGPSVCTNTNGDLAHKFNNLLELIGYLEDLARWPFQVYQTGPFRFFLEQTSTEWDGLQGSTQGVLDPVWKYGQGMATSRMVEICRNTVDGRNPAPPKGCLKPYNSWDIMG